MSDDGSTGDEMTIDSRLAKRAAKGDRGAFGDLVELYKDKIYHLAFRMLGQKQEAEDAVQETFIRVFVNLQKFDPKQKFSTWIFRIATNLCIDRLRRRKSIYSLDAEIPDNEGTDGYDLLPGHSPSPESELMLSETKRQIKEAVDKLPDKYKTVVILRYLHDMSLQEISDILDLPVTTIKTRIHRGRESLRKKMNQASLL